MNGSTAPTPYPDGKGSCGVCRRHGLPTILAAVLRVKSFGWFSAPRPFPVMVGACPQSTTCGADQAQVVDGGPSPAMTGLASGYPPVTLICRTTAGLSWRRSMMKSCPFGLRAMAA